MALPFWSDTISGAGAIVPAADAVGGNTPDGTWALDLNGWSQWDTCTIGGRIVPGRVRIQGQKGLRVQRKQSPGQHGATATLLGMDPCDLRISCEMWMSEHLDQYEVLVNMLLDGIVRSMKGKSTVSGTTDPRQQVAWPIQHPGLALLRIYSLYFMEATVPEPMGQQGVYRGTIKMVEFFPRNTGAAASAPRTAKGDNNITSPKIEAERQQREQPPSRTADPETLGPNEFVNPNASPE